MKNNIDADAGSIITNTGISSDLNPNLETLTFHEAALLNDAGLIYSLKEKKPSLDIEAKNADRRTPLMLAALHGKMEAVVAFIKAGASTRVLDKEWNNLFHLAGFSNSQELIDKLIELNIAKTIYIEARNGKGHTPLMLAALYGKMEAVVAFIKAGASTTALDNKGRTPLMLAALHGKMKTVVAFIKAGASTTVLDKEGNNLFHLACFSSLPALIAKLNLACFSSSPALIDKLIELKIAGTIDIDIDAKNINGDTPLMLAALNGKVELAIALIKAGANTEVRDKNGRTALHLCCGYRLKSPAFIDKAIKLKIAGTIDIDIEAKDINGDTPLMLAALNGKVELAIALIEAGANTKVRNEKGNTLFHLAAHNSSPALIDKLIELKTARIITIDIDAKNGRGNTPLMIAAYLGRVEVVVALMQAGANIKVENYEKYNLLHKAATADTVELFKLLRDKELNTETKNNDGETPLAAAALNNKQNSVNELIKLGANPYAEYKEKNLINGFPQLFSYEILQSIFKEAITENDFVALINLCQHQFFIESLSADNQFRDFYSKYTEIVLNNGVPLDLSIKKDKAKISLELQAVITKKLDAVFNTAMASDSTETEFIRVFFNKEGKASISKSFFNTENILTSISEFLPLSQSLENLTALKQDISHQRVYHSVEEQLGPIYKSIPLSIPSHKEGIFDIITKNPIVKELITDPKEFKEKIVQKATDILHDLRKQPFVIKEFYLNEEKAQLIKLLYMKVIAEELKIKIIYQSTDYVEKYGKFVFFHSTVASSLTMKIYETTAQNNNKNEYLVSIENIAQPPTDFTNIVGTKRSSTDDQSEFTKKAKTEQNFDVEVTVPSSLKNILNPFIGNNLVQSEKSLSFLMPLLTINFLGEAYSHKKLDNPNSDNKANNNYLTNTKILLEELKDNFDLNKFDSAISRTNLALNILNTGVNIARWVHEPNNLKNSGKLLLDFSYSLYSAANKYLPIIGMTAAAHQLYQKEYFKAFEQAAKTTFYTAGPTIIGLDMPYLSLTYKIILTAYNGHAVLTNVYSFYQEYASYDFNAKSTSAYNKLVQYVANSPLSQVFDFKNIDTISANKDIDLQLRLCSSDQSDLPIYSYIDNQNIFNNNQKYHDSSDAEEIVIGKDDSDYINLYYMHKN